MPKKNRREKEKRERAERDKVSLLDAMNASRLANGHKPLECLPLGFYPNMTFAPSLVAPSPNEGAPLKGSSDATPLEGRSESTPLKGTSLERERPKGSPEEETVLDTTLDPEEEDSASELD
jgi:hypothetical protein